MTGTLAVLVIDITEPQHLADVFGVDATSQALVDIGAQFDALVTRLLVQHEILSYMQQGIPGRWSAYAMAACRAICKKPVLLSRRPVASCSAIC